MRMQNLFYATVMIIALLGVSGCQTRGTPNAAARPTRILDVTVFGYVDRHTSEHVAALKEAVVSLNKGYPILSIRFLDSMTAEVTTGIVRALLDGEGHSYIFRLKNGKWTSDRTNGMMWVS